MREPRAPRRSEWTRRAADVSRLVELSRRRLSLTLVLDTDVAAARNLQVQLRSAGFPAVVATTRKDAFEVLSCSYVDAVVVSLDVALTGDLAFLEALHRASRRTWLVVASARGGERARQAVFRHGGDALLPQPCTLEDLMTPLTGFTARSRWLL